MLLFSKETSPVSDFYCYMLNVCAVSSVQFYLFFELATLTSITKSVHSMPQTVEVLGRDRVNLASASFTREFLYAMTSIERSTCTGVLVCRVGICERERENEWLYQYALKIDERCNDSRDVGNIFKRQLASGNKKVRRSYYMLACIPKLRGIVLA